MIGAYFKFIALPEDVKRDNRINSKARLDCVSYADIVEGGYSGLTYFVNQKKCKGQLFFYKVPCLGIVNTDKKRLAEWFLSSSGLNFSSIYIEDVDFPEFGYGYPNGSRLLANGGMNPLFPFKNDCYLFIVNSDYSMLELFVVLNGRNLVRSYYQRMIDGDFEEEFALLRSQAKSFYPYVGLSL